MEIKKISVEELCNLEIASFVLLDVRTPSEFNSKHLTGALSLPLNQLNEKNINTNLQNKENKIILVCGSGNRATKAYEILSNLGYVNLKVLDGGIKGCNDPRLKMTEGKGVISLERQVRIAAGSFVMLGVFLAYYFSDSFILISAFVGLGLIFSGITDTCGMAVILGKMPWNNQPKTFCMRKI